MLRVKMLVAAVVVVAGFAFAGAKEADAQVIVSRYGAFGRRVSVTVGTPYGLYPTYPAVVAPYPAYPYPAYPYPVYPVYRAPRVVLYPY